MSANRLSALRDDTEDGLAADAAAFCAKQWKNSQRKGESSSRTQGYVTVGSFLYRPPSTRW